MPNPNRWDASQQAIVLSEGEIHVWRADLNCEERIVEQLASSLSPDERARAARFHFLADRNHFVVARGALRDLLGKYSGSSADEIQFEYGQFGKPAMSAGFSLKPIQFNISHSGGLALLAFSLRRELGVDVERVRPDFGGDDVAERYFAPEEVAELRALPAALRAKGFFHCWTRKEAYLKAKGAGLQIPLKSFRVSVTPGAPERLHATDSRQWRLHSLEPVATHVGAVVGEGHDWRLTLLEWKPVEPCG